MAKGLVRQLFWASRPVSWINTAYPFAFASIMLGAQIDQLFCIAVLFFLIPYNLLMYGINDVFDYESDLRNPRKGSIEGAILDKKWHRSTLAWSFGLPIPFVVYLLITGNLWANFWLLLFLFSVVAYSAKFLRFKEIPFLDSITSATHFVGPAVYGIALIDPALLVNPTIVKVIFAFMLWGMASHAFGAVQDIKADREGKLKSIATELGAANTSRFAFFCYLLAALLLILAGGEFALASIAAVPYLVIIGRYLKLKDADCEQANRGWRKFIWLNFFAGALISILAF